MLKKLILSIVRNIKMKNDFSTVSSEFWERCWRSENLDELMRFLAGYVNLGGEIFDIFKNHGVKKVCDAACGFGGYSLAFATNGFTVSGFDISPTAVKITCDGLNSYGIDSSGFKTADILNTGYADGEFDGVVAHAVIDHLTVADAQNAVKELCRITAHGGLVFISFDTAEPDDLAYEHEMIEPGTMLYTDGSQKGMLFHPYEWDEIDSLLSGLEVIYRKQNAKNEKSVIVRK